MKRILLFLPVLITCAAFLSSKSFPPTSAQTPTDEVAIVQLTTPTNAVGVDIRSVSDDGKRIVFDSINDYDGNNVDSNREIFVFDVDARRMIQLTITANVPDPADTTKTLYRVTNNTPIISGDGTRIVFTSNAKLTNTANDDANQEIYLATLPRNATSAAQATFTRLTDTGADTASEVVREIFTNYSPTISGNGNLVSFVSTRRNFAALENGTTAFSAARENNADPDGNGEIFTYDVTARRYAQVTVTRDVDATVNFTVRGFNNFPHLSGDGRRLAFISAFNYPGASANKNTDFNGEIFVYNTGAAANTLLQLTETNAENNGPAVPAGSPINLLPVFVEPFNQTGTLLVFESSGNFTSNNGDKTREIFLADLSGATPQFRQITNQATVDIAKNDFNFHPSINATGTFITFGSTLNLTPATTSSVTADNADSSREIFRYDIARSTATQAQFLQITFTPKSDLVFDQRAFIVPSFPTDTGNLVTFSLQSNLIASGLTLNPEAFQALVVPVTAKNEQAPAFANAASFNTAEVARGSIVAVFGTQLANSRQSATTLPLPVQLGGVTATVRGVAGQIIFISPTQINIVLPNSIAVGDKVPVSINNNGIQSTGEVKVVDVSPGVFSLSGDGKGRSAAQCGRISDDGLVFQTTNPPCFIGSTTSPNLLVIYGTGWRNGTGITVKIGEQTLTPEFAGAQPDFAGLDQINLPLTPELVDKVDQEISVLFGTVESNKTTTSFAGIDSPFTVANAASFENGEVARGSLGLAQGDMIANDTVDASSTLPFELRGVRVTAGGRAARLQFISPTQINFVVPNELAAADKVEVLINNNGKIFRTRVKVSNASPGLFTATSDGAGRALATCGRIVDGVFVIAGDPPCSTGSEAAPGALRLFGTGWRNADKVTLKIGDVDITPTFFGPQNGNLSGIDILNMNLLQTLAGKADVDIVVTTTSGSVTKASKAGVKISFQ